MEAYKNLPIACKVIDLNPRLPLSFDAKLFNKLVIHEMSAIHLIDFSDIIYAMSCGNYTTIYLRDSSQITASNTLKTIESKLPSNRFFRIHQSYVVRLDQIIEITKNEVGLPSKLRLPLSRRRRSALLGMLEI